MKIDRGRTTAVLIVNGLSGVVNDSDAVDRDRTRTVDMNVLNHGRLLSVRGGGPKNDDRC